MAISTKDSQTEATQKPAPFSYAQAAKGKSTTVTKPLVTMQQEKESISWADDIDTVIDETHQNGTLRTNGTSEASEVAEKTPSTQSSADTPDTNTTMPSLDSPSYESSATTAKNDDGSSPARSAADSTWERGSMMESSLELRNDAEGSSQKDNSDEASRKGSASGEGKTLREAPPPPVNFWAKRIEANKTKPVQNSLPAHKLATPRSNGIPTVPTAIASTKDASSNHDRGNESYSSTRDIAFPRGNKTRGGGPNRQRFSEPNSTRSIAPPPSGDNFAWPTVSAPGRGEKTDQERGAMSTTGTHGKPRFDQKMDLTPSVVFETRLPEGGRGLRSHVKGSPSDAPVRRLKQQPAMSGSGPGNEKSSLEDKGAAASSRRLSTNVKAQAGRTIPDVAAQPQDVPSTNHQRRSTQHEAGVDSSVADISAPRQNGGQTSDKLSQPNTVDTKEETAVRDVTSSTPLVDAVSKDNVWDPSANSQNSNQFTRPDAMNRRKIAHTDLPRGSFDNAARRGKKSPTEGRSRAHSQGLESYPYSASRTPRGGGRGRGARARADFAGSQHQAHFGQSALPMLQTNPSSTSKGSPPYTSPFSAPPGHDRRGPRGSSQRASVPNDSFYGRHHPHFSANSPYGVYPSPMYEYGMTPMSAYPYGPQVEQYFVYQMVAQQLSYYFSLENILKDMFLRQHMDSQGFVALSLIANFKRIKDLTPDYELVKSVALQSSELEVRMLPEGQAKVRRRSDWKEWILPMEQRHESAQNDGPPEPAQQPLQPHGNKSPLHRTNGLQHGMNGSSGSEHTDTPGSVPRPSAPQWSNGHVSGAQHSRHVSSTMNPSLPAYEAKSSTPASSTRAQAPVEDDFLDSNIPTLMLAVKKIGNQQPPRPQHLSTSSRTFSNGSLEDGIPTDGVQRPRSALGIRDVDAERPFRAAKSPSRPPKSSLELFWLKGNDTTATELPSNGDSEPYFQVHTQAMEARRNASSGDCPYELQVLYQFWSHFLIRHFNTTMYDEFRQLAREDIEQGSSDSGMKHLLVYYNEALVNHRAIRDRVARHYVQLVAAEDTTKSARPAFEQLRKAWLNGALNLRNRKRVTDWMSEELKAELDRRATLSTTSI